MEQEKVANSGNSPDSEDENHSQDSGVRAPGQRHSIPWNPGVPAHIFTDEDRRKGAETTNNKRREANRDMMELARDLVMNRAELLIKPYAMAMEQGDWRAAEALQDRIFGKPTQRTETADVTPEREYTRQELERLAKRHIKSVEEDAA